MRKNRKKNQKEFRIEKVIKRTGKLENSLLNRKFYVKWKG